jgi:hypothetical protein
MISIQDDAIEPVVSNVKPSTDHIADCDMGCTSPPAKPTTPRQSSDMSVSSNTSSKRSFRAAAFSLRTALKKPFQGWSREALWAKSGIDDVYNFPTARRRGVEGGAAGSCEN